jgi:DNA-binding Lrp family transcriptional regulator
MACLPAAGGLVTGVKLVPPWHPLSESAPTTGRPETDQKASKPEHFASAEWRNARMSISGSALEAADLQRRTAPPMDDTDRELLSLLRADARATVASLAKVLRVARGTVQNRIARLEREGIIVGYTVRVRPQLDERRITALMTLAVEGNQADAVLRALRGDPAVQTLHTTNGRWDIVAELHADSLEAFDRVLGRIRLIEGVAQSETSLLLSTHKL